MNQDKTDEPEKPRPTKKHPHIKNIFAGSVSSSLSRFFGQPLDVLKVRFQLQQTHHKHVAVEGTQIVYRSIPHAIKLIYLEEGIGGLWRGHNVSQLQGFFQGVTQFWTFEQARKLLMQTPLQRVQPLCDFTAGFLTGTLIVIMLSPIDMMRTRMMARSPILDGRRSTILSTAHEIFATGGLRGFYYGSSTSLLHFGSLLGTKFMFYDILCDIAIHYTSVQKRSDLPGPTLMLAGAGSGLLSNVFTYPLDLIKRRLQMHYVDGPQHPNDSVCRDILQCCRVVFQKEGMLGLYKGFLPCCIKSIVSTAVQFSAYDKLRNWIDKYL